MSVQQRHRRSIRMQGYDYSGEGSYFITIVTYNRDPIFGTIVDENVVLNPFGKIVLDSWKSLPIRYPRIELDESIIMPNHFHAVVNIFAPVGAIHESPLPEEMGDRVSRRKMLLPLLVGYLKMNSAKKINLLRGSPGIPVWQRNYYEHVISTDREYDEIVEYIHTNPRNWGLDEENTF